MNHYSCLKKEARTHGHVTLSTESICHWSRSQQPTPYKSTSSRNQAFHVRSATPISCRSGYTACILDRGKAAWRRFQSQPWVNGMDALEKESMAIIESLNQLDDQSDYGVSITPGQTQLIPSLTRLTQGFNHIIVMTASSTVRPWSLHVHKNSSCVCGSSEIDEPC